MFFASPYSSLRAIHNTGKYLINNRREVCSHIAAQNTEIGVLNRNIGVPNSRNEVQNFEFEGNKLMTEIRTWNRMF